MKIKDLIIKIDGTVTGFDTDREVSVEYAFASDLMSDVLRLDKDGILLITGLCNIQTLRTAEMADIQFIIFTRDKKATCEMREIAEENQICLIETPFSSFKTSGILYKLGYKPIY